MAGVRAGLLVVGAIALLALALAPLGSGSASARCSKAEARRIVDQLRLGDPTVADPFGKVVCGAFAGPGSDVMVVMLRGGGNSGFVHWAVFRWAGGTWQFLMKEGAGASITAAGSNIRQTLPIYRLNDPRCCPTGGSKTRLWRWNGSRFVAGPWKRLPVRGASLDRAVTDLPDDISGPQVHFLYVVPADGADQQLDTNGAMHASITRIERWFANQAGNQGLRVDTHNGVPDITFVRMRRTDAQATATDPWPLWVMGEDLVAAGFNDQAKVYAALYGGHSTWACGGATSPALPKLGAMYLEAQPTGGYGPCKNAPGFGTGVDRPGYFEIGLLHEILHVIGFTPTCAPHASQDQWRSHVNDSPTDIMYGPDAAHPAGWQWSRAVLDFNRDDYYRANVPGCYDLSDSPYLAPVHSVSVSVNGAGTVTSAPAGIACPGSCVGKFQRSVTLTPTPSTGAVFRGWTGACSGTGSCVVAGEASATATFGSLSHPRTLTLRIRARRAAGTLGVADGFAACRERAAVLIERRGKRGWAIVRRARTNGAGLFAAPIPKGVATYRARAPETSVNGERCVGAVSRAVKGI